MIRRGTRLVRRLLGYGLAAYWIIALVMFTGCSSDGTGDAVQSEGPWPAEVERITPSPGGRAIVFPGDGALVFAAGELWKLEDDGFARQATFSDDYRVVLDEYYAAGSPMMGEVQSLDGRVLFAITGDETVSDGQGVEQTENYEDLVFVDPEEPARRELVYREAGSVDTARLHVSENGTALLAVVGGDGEQPVLRLLARAGDGAWRTVWSSDAAGGGDGWVPWAHGFVAEPDSDEVSLVVVGDADETPGVGEPVVVAVASDGTERVIVAELPDDLQHVAALNQLEFAQGDGFALTYETDEEQGVLVATPGVEGLSAHATQGRPLQVDVDDDGVSVLVRGGQQSGPLELMSLADGTATRLLDDSDAYWVQRLVATADAPVGFALLGLSASGENQSSWSVKEVRVTADGAVLATTLFDAWPAPNKYWNVASLYEIDASASGGGSALLIGMGAGDEGAFGTLSAAE